ncbi:cytochrome b5-like heme/steroid binding domain-containing protein, partial [Catenaria anguillulae PL171]
DRSLLSPVFPTISSAQRVSSGTAPGSGRNKVALEPGHSPLDWAQYKNSGQDLTGIPAGQPRVRLTMDEVAKHKSVDDCWTVLNGKVYNMTAYVKYHPGGVKQLMKGAGKDSTKLFLAVHAWVNADYLLDACYLGLLES